MRTIRTDRARQAFIEALAVSGNVTEACTAAAMGRTAAYAWRDDDADFKRDWDVAVETAIDRLEKAAFVRAVDGWNEPVFHKGAIVGHVRRFSDRMAELLLKGHRPAKYVERHELSGPGGGPLEVTDPKRTLLRGIVPDAGSPGASEEDR